MSQSIFVRVTFQEDKHLWTLSCGTESLFSQLVSKIQTVYPGRTFRLSYIDDEGDTCQMTCDAELKEAAQHAQNLTTPLTVQLSEKAGCDTDTDSECDFVVLHEPIRVIEPTEEGDRPSTVSIASAKEVKTEPAMHSQDVKLETNHSPHSATSASSTINVADARLEEDEDDYDGEGEDEDDNDHDNEFDSDLDSPDALDLLKRDQRMEIKCAAQDAMDLSFFGLTMGQHIIVSSLLPDLATPLRGVVLRASGDMLTVKLIGPPTSVRFEESDECDEHEESRQDKEEIKMMQTRDQLTRPSPCSPTPPTPSAVSAAQPKPAQVTPLLKSLLPAVSRSPSKPRNVLEQSHLSKPLTAMTPIKPSKPSKLESSLRQAWRDMIQQFREFWQDVKDAFEPPSKRKAAGPAPQPPSIEPPKPADCLRLPVEPRKLALDAKRSVEPPKCTVDDAKRPVAPPKCTDDSKRPVDAKVADESPQSKHKSKELPAPLNTSHDLQLAQLLEMGYTDTKALVPLLAKANGNVQLVVSWLTLSTRA